MMTQRRVLTVAFLAGLLVLVAGAWIESVLISALQATGHELEWVSDLIAAAAVTALTYLWLHLRAHTSRSIPCNRTIQPPNHRTTTLALAHSHNRALPPNLWISTAP